MEQLCNVCQITVTADPSGLCDACHLDKVEAVREDLLEALKELADIFPEDSMGEMDASDFKDRSHRIWTASQTAKNLIAKAEKQAWRTT